MILTSNRTRELSDALKRRCLFHWIDYPNAGREPEIVQARLPGVSEADRHSVVSGPPAPRAGCPYELPGCGGGDGMGQALLAIGEDGEPRETLGSALKVIEDLVRVRELKPCSRVSEPRAR